jgi:hypothetical protein
LKTVARGIQHRAGGLNHPAALVVVNCHRDDGIADKVDVNDFWFRAETLNNQDLRETAFVPGRPSLRLALMPMRAS